jgi:hypothetical protein
LSDAPWLSRRRPGSLYSIIESSFNTNKRGDEQEEELFLLLLLPRAVWQWQSGGLPVDSGLWSMVFLDTLGARQAATDSVGTRRSSLD